MRFTAIAITLALSVESSAFTAPSVGTLAFTRTSSLTSSTPTRQTVSGHTSSCACRTCNKPIFALGMSDDSGAEAVVEDAVPEEVAALDGIADEEEAHNAARPQRDSGKGKHKGGRNKGKPITDLEVGTTVTGTVKTVTSYGAFLNIGYSTDALLHISRMSDDFVSDVNDVVKEGDEVSVRVFSVDTDKGQIGVTMRSEEKEAEMAANRDAARGKRKSRPQRSGGDRAAQSASMAAMAAKGFDEEKFVEGEVVSILDFGAFVRLDTAQVGEGLTGEVDGLVHISALAKERVDAVSSVVSIGDKVQVRVKEVDGDAGKVSLSMISKADEPPPRQPRQRRESNPDGKREWRGGDGDQGETEWKKIMDEMEQPSFKNSLVLK